mmetsp:Transcript_53063/g.152990  ORF Transcript_53063/g.152990 Transcript_53063/m.152990 type:complete len:264 (-) Transcript_53063:31-822(-)
MPTRHYHKLVPAVVHGQHANVHQGRPYSPRLRAGDSAAAPAAAPTAAWARWGPHATNALAGVPGDAPLVVATRRWVGPERPFSPRPRAHKWRTAAVAAPRHEGGFVDAAAADSATPAGGDEAWPQEDDAGAGGLTPSVWKGSVESLREPGQRRVCSLADLSSEKFAADSDCRRGHISNFDSVSTKASLSECVYLLEEPDLRRAILSGLGRRARRRITESEMSSSSCNPPQQPIFGLTEQAIALHNLADDRTMIESLQKAGVKV